MVVFIVIPVHNRKKLTLCCLDCLRKQDYKNIQIVICDDGSTDGTSDAIKEYYPEVVLLKGDGNYWWSKSVNICIKYILERCNANDYILTLNDDLIIENTYISSLVDCAKRNPNALIGSLAVDIKDPSSVIDSGFLWNRWLAKYIHNIKAIGSNIKKYNGTIQTSMLSGRGAFIPSKVFREIGLYDDKHLPQYSADEDFSLRAYRHGYLLIISSNAVVKIKVELTGIASPYEQPQIRRLISSFFSIKSHNWWRTRYYFARNNLPSWYYLIYFCFDYIRIISSFFKRYIIFYLR